MLDSMYVDEGSAIAGAASSTSSMHGTVRPQSATHEAADEATDETVARSMAKPLADKQCQMTTP